MNTRRSISRGTAWNWASDWMEAWPGCARSQSSTSAFALVGLAPRASWALPGEPSEQIKLDRTKPVLAHFIGVPSLGSLRSPRRSWPRHACGHDREHACSPGRTGTRRSRGAGVRWADATGEVMTEPRDETVDL